MHPNCPSGVPRSPRSNATARCRLKVEKRASTNNGTPGHLPSGTPRNVLICMTIAELLVGARRACYRPTEQAGRPLFQDTKRTKAPWAGGSSGARATELGLQFV